MKKTRKTQSTSLRLQDPFLSREKSKYKNPLPSREWIIQILTQKGVPVSVKDLQKTLSIRPDEYDIFSFRLNAMVRDGEILINRRGDVCIADKMELVKCRVIGHKDGFGFASPVDDPEKADFVLHEKQMRSLMHGDLITIKQTGIDHRQRPTGRVIDVLERAHQTIVARAYWEFGMALAYPEDRRIPTAILLPNTDKKAFQDGQVVSVAIEHYPTNNRPATGKIIEILGDYGDSGMEIEIALRKHQLPYQFSEATQKALKRIPQSVTEKACENREDLRDLPLVTIDGEDSRDFDDAVYVEKKGRAYRLIVAIADVAHYVQPNTPIDKDARERGTSVYFPRRVIPMLPEKLSNGICSLNPNEDRLVMVCDINITATGNLKDYRFYPAVMRSHARLTYNEVWGLLQSKEKHHLRKELERLYQLFQILQKKRQERGAMDFDSQETQMIFDENGKIKSIQPRIRNDAHRLIEECMLAANVCAADFLQKNQHPALYRVHTPPTESKLKLLRDQLRLLGLTLEGQEKPTPQDFMRLSEAINERPDAANIRLMLLKSMQQAVYQPENEGHFGLAYEAYTHFTSPIRRYPDLTVHRAIKAILHQQIYQESWQALGDHCSRTERRADDASLEVVRWLKTYYMRDKIGSIFSGRVSGISAFGVFVTLDEIYVDGMIHVSDLGKDYFNYRPEIMAMEGERTHRRYMLGDSVTVKVAQADLDTCRIDLVLVETEKPSTTKTPKRSVKKVRKSRP